MRAANLLEAGSDLMGSGLRVRNQSLAAPTNHVHKCLVLLFLEESKLTFDHFFVLANGLQTIVFACLVITRDL